MSPESSAQKVRASAVRALALMGENELVRKATGRRPLGSRGVNLLSLDGGGMRGMATVRMLRRLEEGTGRRIHELFDLICGTST
jgi:predicted acylesterase/phospholipase RssA